MSTEIIEYMSGLTGFAFDESVLKRIAADRGVEHVMYVSQLSQKAKDLLLADLLWTASFGPNNIPSFQHQHGQFSTSIGQQTIGNRDRLYDMAMRLYRKWGDERADLVSDSCLSWKF